jgi:two-component system sensor histidine kinase KdpD
VTSPSGPRPDAPSVDLDDDLRRLRARVDELELAIRAERQTVAELRAIDEVRNAFLAAVSHDLRTPLAAIMGLARTLERRELHEDDARDLAARIGANARRLDRMVSDLLDLDRLATGVVESSPHRSDLAEMVARIVANSDVLDGREVAVETSEALAQLDAAQVERIVENLLANAVRHTPPEARIWVSVRPEDGGALLAVEDDGPGVPDDQRAAIFEPFRRAGADHAASVGVGLAVVARFAELHGGRAWVQERVGGGASFRVWFPERTGGSDPPPEPPG